MDKKVLPLLSWDLPPEAQNFQEGNANPSFFKIFSDRSKMLGLPKFITEQSKKTENTTELSRNTWL